MTIFMTRPEEMLAEHKTRYFHDSTFVDLGGGRLLHASKTTFCTSDDGGITWSKDFQCKDKDGNAVGGDGNSLVKLSGNGIGMAAMRRGKGVDHPDWMEQYTYMVFWRSEDGGKTWEAPVRISRPGVATYSYQDVLLRTTSGRIVLPVYISRRHLAHAADPVPPDSGKLVFNQWVGTGAHYYDPDVSSCQAYHSDDDGRTWKVNKDGDLFVQTEWGAWTTAATEPSVAEVSPGKLVMTIRNSLGRLYQAWSYDNGETWTTPFPTSLAASTAPAQIRTIPSTGHILIVWNQEGPEEIQSGRLRMRLSSAVSRNGGSVWEFYQNITSYDDVVRVEPGPIEHVRPAEVHFKPSESAPIRNGESVKTTDFHGRWCYPSLLVMKDRVIVTHTFVNYAEHSTKAILVRPAGPGSEYNQIMKVLPLTWFYGGKEPADSNLLPRAADVAVP